MILENFVNINLIKIRTNSLSSGLRNGNFSGLRYVNRKNFRFTEWKPKIFSVYEMETGNFPVSIYTGIIPEFRFTQQISGSFHFQNGNFFPEKWKP